MARALSKLPSERDANEDGQARPIQTETSQPIITNIQFTNDGHSAPILHLHNIVKMRSQLLALNSHIGKGKTLPICSYRLLYVNLKIFAIFMEHLSCVICLRACRCDTFPALSGCDWRMALYLVTPNKISDLAGILSCAEMTGTSTAIGLDTDGVTEASVLALVFSKVGVMRLTTGNKVAGLNKLLNMTHAI